MYNFEILISVLGALVGLTNVIVQVTKKVTWDKLPTNLVTLAVAEALTAASGAAYCQIEAVPMTWHIAAAVAAGGFMVAYAAMFGFDKLREIMRWGENR